MTFGYSVMKRVTTARAMVSPVRMKAHPSRLTRSKASAPSSETAASAAVIHVTELALVEQRPAEEQDRDDRGRESRPVPTRSWALSRTTPLVLRARKVAPCVVNRPSVTTPPSSAYGFSRLKNPPV